MAAPVAPGVPVITSVTPGVLGQGRVDVTVEFGFTTPIPTAVYSVVAGKLNNPLDPGNRTALTTTVGTAQSGTVSIAVNTIYYIWGAATDNGQTVFSTPLVFNGATFGKPGTPFLVAQNPAENTYTWNFITEDIFPPLPQFSFVFSPNSRTDSPPAINLNANPTGAPGTYAVGPASIPVAGSPVYIWGRSVNSSGTEVFSQVPLVYTVGGTGTPPSGPTSSPTGVNPRANTQLSVTFNTNGITGTLPFAVNCLASTSPTGPFDIACAVELISPNNYLATTVDDLIPGTTYYFQTTVSNNFLPNQSIVSGPWATTNVAQVSAPVPTLVQATQVTMRFSVPTSGFNPADRVGLLRWEAVDSTTVALANAVATTYLGVINTQHTWEGTVFGLTPGRQYFFQGQYEPVGLSSTTGLVTAQGNDFDLGYTPPRPWATPSPVIVSGVSQPWRQT